MTKSRFSLSENESSAEAAFLTSALVLSINLFLIMSIRFSWYRQPKPLVSLSHFDVLLLIAVLFLGSIALFRSRYTIDRIFFVLYMATVAVGTAGRVFNANGQIQAAAPYVRTLMWFLATLLAWFIFRGAKAKKNSNS
jgi:hypothetical protein